MPSESSASARRRAEPTRWGRWAALFLAFTLEYFAVAGGIDAQLVAQARGGWWSALFNFELLGRAAFLSVICALVLLRPSRVPLQPLALHAERTAWFAHALIFAVFWAMTRAMFRSALPPPGPALVWLVGWGLAGAASAASLCVGLLGMPRIRPAVLLAALGSALALAWLMNEFGRWTQNLWRPFSASALAMAAFLLEQGFTNVEVDATNYVLTVDGFTVHIAGACSGLESMGMGVLLTSLYLATFRRQLRFPRALLLLPLALLLTWLGNGFRLAVMMWIGARVDPNLALDGFHSKAGWALFATITLGITYLGHHSPWFTRASLHTDNEPDEQLTTAFLLPLTMLLAIALVSGMVGHSEGGGYALRMALGVLTLALLWKKYDDLRWREPGALVACTVGFVLGLAWLGSGWPFPTATIDSQSGSNALWLVVRALGFSTVVPLAEELAFRGYLLRVLQNRHFEHVSYRSAPWWAIAISSLVFGALHERWLAGTLAGLVYALIQIRGGRLRDAVLAHASTNATLAVFALALQNPSFFG